MSAESACFFMSHNFKEFPTGVPFTSALLSEVIPYHPKQKAAVNTGQFKWLLNDRNSNMRVLHFEQTEGVWESIGWSKSAVKYDGQLKKRYS
jgi:hypothetical protein